MNSLKILATPSVLVLCGTLVVQAGGFGQGQQSPTPQTPNPAFADVKDDPALPRVLLIGDSISIGYTLPTRRLLQGKANVHRIPVNGGPTINGLENLDRWLGSGKWDVIHFNWGLHDLRFMEDSTHQVEIDEYEKNLRELVARSPSHGSARSSAPRMCTTPSPAMKCWRNAWRQASGSRSIDIRDTGAWALDIGSPSRLSRDDARIVTGGVARFRSDHVRFGERANVDAARRVIASIGDARAC